MKNYQNPTGSSSLLRSTSGEKCAVLCLSLPDGPRPRKERVTCGGPTGQCWGVL